MRFNELRVVNERLCATTGVYERRAIIRSCLLNCEDTFERVTAARFLIGEVSRARRFDIKERFIAKDFGLDGRQSLEDLVKMAQDRAECGESNPTIDHVHAVLADYLLADDRSNAAKSRLLNTILFGFAKSKDDIPFLLRIICEKVNNGVDAKLILHALGEKLYDVEDLTRGYAFNPVIDDWIEDFDEGRLVGDPIEAVPTPGVPLQPQLCAPVTDLKKVLIQHQGMTLVQKKLDGIRCHIHIWIEPGPDGLRMRKCRIFSRTQQDITADYPEIEVAAARIPIGSYAILDGELVALGEDGEIAPFSVLQKRLGRKTDQDSVKVGVVLYDVLLWDATPMTTTQYGTRINFLHNVIRNNPKIRVLGGTVCASLETLQNMLLQAYEDGEEGLVCKDPNSFPEPGQRSKAWLKCKPDYMEMEGFGDSMDLIVIGYQKGRGKRHGRIGALWVGIRDDIAIHPVCKVGTGFTDEDLDWWTEKVGLAGSDHPQGSVVIRGEPPEVDYWLFPEHVIEVKAAGMTKIDKWSGMSLRFPRIIRRRDDKTVFDSTSTAELSMP